MPIESKLKRVERPDDPRRCQATTGVGQCPYAAAEGVSYCVMHGGSAAQRQIKQEMRRKYQLAKWQHRVNEFADDDQVKGLREEIGILRMTLENIIKQCHSEMDVLLWSGKIGDLVSKIEKVVTSCHRLEAASGMLLDKAAALNLASQIVEIISRHVSDGPAVDEICDGIIRLIVQPTPTEKDS